MVGRYIWSRSSQSVEIKSGILSMSKHSLVIVLSCTWSTVVGIMDMRLACKCPGDDSRGGGEAKPLNLVISSRLYDEACCLARHHHNYRAGKIDGEAPARRRRRAALQNITPDGRTSSSTLHPSWRTSRHHLQQEKKEGQPTLIIYVYSFSRFPFR